MNYIYLQCDCRFNNWLIESIGNRYAIEFTLEKCKQVSETEIVASIFECDENKQLINILGKYGIKVFLTKEEDVNKRFLTTVMTMGGNLIIRVCGDQVLLDSSITNKIVEEMDNNNYDFFYEGISGCILPDIVSTACLKKYMNELKNTERYFYVLKERTDIKRYKMPYPLMLPYDFRINSNNNYRVCRNVIENKLDIFEMSNNMIGNIKSRNSYLSQTGLLASWIIPSEYSDFYYEEDGTVNPWIGRTAIDLIKNHLNKRLKVFEWGMGNSTLFWSEYVLSVISVEHNKEWYEKMCHIVPQNVECRYRELEYGGKYCEEILNTNDVFDIIMIDGRDRVNCAKNAVKKLQSGGVIIWDNSERESYRPGFEYLKSQGFKQLELNSVIYGLPGITCYTSIFYKTNNVLDL
jgi:spore coat polysaccharide biosynthesis protein SpsF (cytidylyltransferase family)